MGSESKFQAKYANLLARYSATDPYLKEAWQKVVDTGRANAPLTIMGKPANVTAPRVPFYQDPAELNALAAWGYGQSIINKLNKPGSMMSGMTMESTHIQTRLREAGFSDKTIELATERDRTAQKYNVTTGELDRNEIDFLHKINNNQTFIDKTIFVLSRIDNIDNQQALQVLLVKGWDLLKGRPQTF